ncbi:hypothetical protein HMSSN036_36450 [Paenibacillus macerans]|nr:hypothetical protein HMSSN036_36450 [Paenibacillus macerans]
MYEWEHHNPTVAAVQNPAMTGQQLPRILNTVYTFVGRLDQIAELSDDGGGYPNRRGSSNT